MGVEMQNVKDFKLNKDGNIGSFQCAKCHAKFNNPLLENNYKRFDRGCEVRMSRGKIEIRCQECDMPLIVVTP